MESSSDGGEYHQQVLLALLEQTFVAPTTGVWMAIIVILILVFISAMISGSEVAFTSLTSGDLEDLQADDTKASKRVLSLLSDPNPQQAYRYLLATILITNNLVNISIAVIAARVFAIMFPIFNTNPVLGFLVTTVVFSFIIVVFGENLPKAYSSVNNRLMAFRMSGPLLFLKKLFLNLRISTLLVESTELIEKRLQKRSGGASYNTELSQEELEKAIELTREGNGNGEGGADMLKGIIKFGNIAVKQVMKARVDVTALEKDTDFKELIKLVRESGFSRIPVYEEDLDNIAGVLYVKDLLEYLDEESDFNWQELLKTPLFVPETKKIDDLLKEMQEDRVHLAIVVDEYGGTSGIITLEDILEEIIGDIKDEYDTLLEIDYKQIDSNTYMFEGKTMLQDICRVLELRDDTFDEVKGDADSLAGLVLEIAGKIPLQNEEVFYENYVFKVISVTKNRIKRVRITILENEISEQEEV